MSTSKQQYPEDPDSLQYYAPRRLREQPNVVPTSRPWSREDDRSVPSASLDPRADDEEILPANSYPEAASRREPPEFHFARQPQTGGSAASIVRFAAIAVVAAGVALLYVAYFTGPRSQAPAIKETKRTLPAIPQMKLASLDPSIQKTAAPKIAVTDGSANSNEPLPLGIKVTDEAPDATVSLSGFLDGTKLTTGVSAGAGKWRVTVRDLPWTTVIPPRDYAGQMNVVAEIARSNGKPAAQDVVRLSWKQTAAPPAAPDRTQASAPTALSAKSAAAEEPARHSASAAEEPARHIDPGELAALIKRGEELASSGDISAARLLLQRAAEAHDAHAAFELAETYDPTLSGQLGTAGARPDLALAKTWYQRARDWGAPDAARQLQALANANR